MECEIFRILLKHVRYHYQCFNNMHDCNFNSFPKCFVIIDTFLIKGATKLYFTHYSCVVIILSNTGLHKSSFSTDSYRKLVIWFLRFLRCVEFSTTFINFITFALHNHCLHNRYQVLCVFFSLISKKRYAS